MIKIGVFDSGVGGLSVAEAIRSAVPQVQVVFRHDTPDHFPYAEKSPAELYGYVQPILQTMADEGCSLIVIACNTVSTTLIERLQENVSTELLGVEPMLAEAAEITRSGVIGVCATPTTLQSARYNQLRRQYTVDLVVVEPSCADWSYLIEQNALNSEKIRADIAPCLAAGADVIVLGCTHYHWVEADIKQLVGSQVTVLQPEAKVIKAVTDFIRR